MPVETRRLQLPESGVGEIVDLPGRGTVFLRDISGPQGAPVLVLLHGWMATADLNWGFSYPALAEEFRVIALDLHGHGRGVNSSRRFSFAACADDVVAILDHLGISDASLVGYSMGGPVALECARRHPDRVAGLVLCATAGAFVTSPVRRMLMRPLTPLTTATRLVPSFRWRNALRRRFIAQRAAGHWQDWITDELEPSDLTTMLQAGLALTNFDGFDWIRDLDVAASCVIPTGDTLVPPGTQRTLYSELSNAERFEVDGDHLVCFNSPDVFVASLMDATRSMVDRSG